MAETQATQNTSSHEGQFPRIGSYWAYFRFPHQTGLSWVMIPRAVVRVESWSNDPNGTSSLELLICFEADVSELDPHKVEDMCRLEAELRQLDTPKFWELVDQGLLALIGPGPSLAHYPYQLRLP